MQHSNHRQHKLAFRPLLCPDVEQGVQDALAHCVLLCFAMRICLSVQICGAFQRHESFKEEKRSQTDFTVRHYAGEVTYSVTGFLEKNKDPISQDLLVRVPASQLLKPSSSDAAASAPLLHLLSKCIEVARALGSELAAFVFGGTRPVLGVRVNRPCG